MKIFTDGSVHPNPNGNGGWAFVAINDKLVTAKWGFDVKTTNNRMEMMAVIEAMGHLSIIDIADIYTDSEYVSKGINHWCYGWRKAGWPDHIKNKDLWLKMLAEADTKGSVMVKWTKAHCNNFYNDLADRLANFARVNKFQQIMEFPVDDQHEVFRTVSYMI